MEHLTDFPTEVNGPSPEDLEWYTDHPDLFDTVADEDAAHEEAARRDRSRELRQRFRTVGDLMRSIADHLTSLGLEPEIQADTIGVLYLGHLIEIRPLDLDEMAESLYADRFGVGATPQEIDMMAAGLPVG